jgi:hypothetical protein
VIAYVFLAGGMAGAGALVYYVAPAGRGLHRYVVPRAQLRAKIARLEREADDLACAVTRLTSENTVIGKERDAANEACAEAGRRIAALEERLTEFEELRAENTRLRADLDNARACRPLTAAPDAPTVPQGSRVLPLPEAPFALNPSAAN